jgi:hypothetical protein
MQRLELAHVDARLLELEPGVGLAVEAELQALPQRRRPSASSSTRFFTWSSPTRAT